MSNSNAIDHAAPQVANVYDFIQKQQHEISRVLPEHMSGDRMARLLLTAVRQTPDLGRCTQASFGGAIMTAAALGLEPNTPEGECYLVPYKDTRNGTYECQFQLGYRGVCKLFWQSPLAQHIDAQAVHENDEFDYAYGTSPYLTHKPARGDRGSIVAYYGVVGLTSGATHFAVLTPDEVKSLRRGKVGPDQRFKGGDPMHWMERKVALVQALKVAPKSTALARGMNADVSTGREPQQIAPPAPAVTAADFAPAVTVDTETGEVTDEGEQS